MAEKNYNRAIFFILLFFAFVLGGILCMYMSSFIIPIVVALMLSQSPVFPSAHPDARPQNRWRRG